MTTLGRLQHRLFVPLAAEPFGWFQSRSKRWELRRRGRQYTERQLFLGRRVELRLGYTNPEKALWGTVQQFQTANSVSEFFDRVPFEQVIPIAKSRKEAVQITCQILGVTEADAVPLIGFEVDLD